MTETKLEGRARELLEEKNFANVATLREDGTVHVTPAWVDVDDDKVVLNTAEGRAWPKLARRDPRVTVTVQNLENPYEYVTITGHVVKDTHEGADAHIDSMAKKYLGQDTYPFRQPGEQRVIFEIAPDRIHHSGA
jgi:PPOX class probable F420-dependent enzyme